MQTILGISGKLCVLVHKYKNMKVVKIRNLEFDDLPAIGGYDIFCRHEPDVQAILEPDHVLLSEIQERSYSSIKFLCDGTGSKHKWTNSANIRAGLNEFYSLEDAAKREYKRLGIFDAVPEIKESKSPLVHLMYLLRHANVHATVSQMTVKNINAISNLGTEPREFEMKIVVLDQPVFDDIQKCNEAKKYYHSDELKRASDWLHDNQNIWGVGEVFRRGVSTYLREILYPWIVNS